MAKPIIKTITPFDANTSKMIDFVWTGAIPYNNRMVIFDADTMLSVYDNTYASNYYKLDHEVPAGTLKNGKKYAVQIAVIDRDGNISDFSDKYYFSVLATPSFYFRDLSVDGGNLIENQNYTAKVIYSQSNEEPISSCQFFLHDYFTKDQIDESAIFISTSKLEYTYKGLDSDGHYYFRATGLTKNGIPLDTGYVEIIVRYTNPSLYARMYADVNNVIGTVDYHSNIIDIESDRPSEEYSFDEGFVDLTHANPDKTVTISQSHNLLPTMKVSYIGLEDEERSVWTENSDSVTIVRYKDVKKIEIYGKTVQTSYPVVSLDDYKMGTYRYVDVVNLTIDETVIENVTGSLALRSLPEMLYDEFSIGFDGERVFNKRIGEVSITSSTQEVSSGWTRNKYGRDMYTLYYDIGTTNAYGSGNIFCTALPVMTETSSVRITNDNLLAIMWDSTETNVVDRASAMSWLSRNRLSVIYPLMSPQIFYLSPIVMPNLINIDSVRYSNNFKVPADTATISLRMRDAFKVCDVLKLQCGDKYTLTLSSFIYDDHTLRYKLTVFGVCNYVIYSSPYVFKSWDIMTVHIRRINGIYGLYTFLDEREADPKHNMWFIETEPPIEHTELGDMWFNINYPTTYVDKDTAVRYYRDDEPGGAQNQNIWIGD